jgi:hypothetical protein
MPNEIIDATTIATLRSQMALGRLQLKKKTMSLSLQDQKTELSKYLKKLMELDDLSTDDASFDQVKDMIQDFLFDYNPKPPMSVQSSGWIHWFTKERKEAIHWSYTNRYFSYLTGTKKWTEKATDSIDVSTDAILSHCGDPKSSTGFAIKGLVIGDIQSGKTANYTGLINKAIDTGYKVIIVLTGTTNDLRAQTQKRLDKEVSGYKTDIFDDDDVDSKDLSNFGVSQYDQLNGLQVLTSASKNGDLRRINGETPIGNNSPAFLAVVKKNPSSLRALIKFLKNCPETRIDSESKLNAPVLLIDDEADLASVNTGTSSNLADAKKINKQIRTLLFKTCRRFSYVGYTATPFANIFIAPHDRDLQPDDADDIFPDDFIITLPTPFGYSGPKEYFGIDENTKNDDRGLKMDLVVEIPDEDVEELSGNAQGEENRFARACIPASLREAVMCFLISTGIKISRGIIENYTMLINVDKKIDRNEQLRDNFKNVFNSACQTYNNDPDKREEYRTYWETKIRPVSERRFKEQGKPFLDNWSSIDQGIKKAISWKTDHSVKLIIGRADADDLDYSKTQHGLYVVVGGQKLSRGLTLEGLSVSYFGRNVQAIDTLLQMGRWFGYKKGWLDVCRVFTTKNTANDFVEAEIVSEGLKSEIDKLANNPKATPRTFGLTVKSASRLLPTSKVKLRAAITEKVGFSASLSQTLVFNISQNADNLKLVNDFFDKHNSPSYIAKRKGFEKPLFRNISCQDILVFLEKYNTPSNLVSQWRDYIKLSNKNEELTKWTVVLSTNLSKSDDSQYRTEKISDFDIIKPVRTLSFQGHEGDQIIKIRALTSPSDYIGFFPDEAKPNRNEYDWENDPELAKYYTPDNGILVVYVFDPLERPDDKNNPGQIVEGASSTVGIGIWFPKSNHLEEKWVYANPIEQERLFQNGDAKLASETESENK